MEKSKFAFRLLEEDKQMLTELAKAYGARSPGAFLSELVHNMCSGDMLKIGEFLQRLQDGLSGQMALALKESHEVRRNKPMVRHKSRKAAPRKGRAKK